LLIISFGGEKVKVVLLLPKRFEGDVVVGGRPKSLMKAMGIFV